MDERLLKQIEGARDAEVTRLAARVRKELGEHSGTGAPDLRKLSAEAAGPVRDAAAKLDAVLKAGGEGPAAADAARSFLRRLVEVDVYNLLIAQKLLDTGVRGGGP